MNVTRCRHTWVKFISEIEWKKILLEKCIQNNDDVNLIHHIFCFTWVNSEFCRKFWKWTLEGVWVILVLGLTCASWVNLWEWCFFRVNLQEIEWNFETKYDLEWIQHDMYADIVAFEWRTKLSEIKFLRKIYGTLRIIGQ